MFTIFKKLLQRYCVSNKDTGRHCLMQKITDAIVTTDEAKLQQTWKEIEYHLNVLVALGMIDLYQPSYPTCHP
uniref:Uncharacterized protein n=1 Tax=Echeneis naucrates TaxID=173247 RepID=A0A665WV39_ECHNA